MHRTSSKAAYFSMICFAALLLCSTISCGDSTVSNNNQLQETNDSGVSDTVVTENSERAQYADIAPAVEDLNEYEFRFTVPEDHELCYDQVVYDADEENGDTLNDAVYRRNLAVEEAYNCTITLLTCDDDDAFAKRNIMAGDDYTDIMVINSMSQTTDLAASGYFLNLNALPEMNMEAPWWDDGIRELSIFGKQYVTTGTITIEDDVSIMCVLFSKKLASQYDIEDLYEHVLNGTWTWEMMKNLCKDIYADLDGDGVLGVQDRYSMITNDDGPFWLAIGANMQTVIYNEADETYTSNWMSEDVYTKVAEYLDFAITNPGVIISNSSSAETMFGDNVSDVFKDDRALFWATEFGATVSLRSNEADFGLLPVPKWNEEQEDYCCAVTGGSAPICMPISIKNQHAAAMIAEALAYESMFTVTPAFYDTFLDSKILRDEESLAVVDLIFDSKKYDFDWQLDITEIDRKISNMGKNRRNTLVSTIAAAERSSQKSIDRYIAKYEKLD